MTVLSLVTFGSLILAAGLEVPPSDIIFSHGLHVAENAIECGVCHSRTATSVRADDKLLPEMDACGECHDIEDENSCKLCHRNADDPQAVPNPVREIKFDHSKHMSKVPSCLHCHAGADADTVLSTANMPKMRLCLECHDGARVDNSCKLCHGKNLALSDIHPADWRHQHGDRVSADPNWCTQCHRQEKFCLDCHRGDNLSGNIHDLNFRYSHGLAAISKQSDCRRCHEVSSFCDGCHRSEGRMPWRHSTLTWIAEHGEAARNDAENCASCHDTPSPTCARSACHEDRDGIRGTNPRIHASNSGQFENRGKWHDDSGDYCFDCHVSSSQAGVGFCGYCHGAEGD